MVPRRDPLHRVVVGRVVLVWLAPPQTAQTITFYGLGFSTPQTPLARGAYFGKLDLMASKWRKCEGAYLLGGFQMAKMVEELQLPDASSLPSREGPRSRQSRPVRRIRVDGFSEISADGGLRSFQQASAPQKLDFKVPKRKFGSWKTDFGPRGLEFGTSREVWFRVRHGAPA